MKRIALFLVVVMMAVPLFSVSAQTATPTPTPMPVGGDGRSVQFSVQETPVVADNDTTTMIILVVISVLGWVIFGFVLRPAIIDAGRNLPPGAIEIFIAPINAALKLAQEAAARTPGKLDDATVEELKAVIDRTLSEIVVAKSSPTPPTNP